MKEAQSQVKKANTYLLISYITIPIGVGLVVTSLVLGGLFKGKGALILPVQSGVMGMYSFEW